MMDLLTLYGCLGGLWLRTFHFGGLHFVIALWTCMVYNWLVVSSWRFVVWVVRALLICFEEKHIVTFLRTVIKQTITWCTRTFLLQ